MRKDKKSLKEQYGQSEDSNIFDVAETEKELNNTLDQLGKALELEKKNLIANYE
jgi:hypothetical protein